MDPEEQQDARRAAKLRKLERKQCAGMKRSPEVARENEKASATRFRQAIQVARQSHKK